MDEDEAADNLMRKHMLVCVQVLTFAVAFAVLAMTLQPGDFTVEKTKYVQQAEVEMSFALPKTLQTEAQLMPMGDAKVPMYAVYGRDMTERRIWCATFIDSDEATAWVQASKVFGRAVKGAVIKDQKQETTDAPVEAEKPN
jgi:hypothetical protein